MRDVTRTDWHRRVELAVRRLQASLDDPVRFPEIAAEVASSPYHFHRTFRGLTGETVAHCLRRLRLERAAFQIDRTRRDITAIGLDAGFSSLESFSRAFRREYGVTPSTVRALRALRSWDGLLPSSSGIHYAPDGRRDWFFIREDVNQMDVKIVRLDGQRFYAIRHVGDYWGLPPKMQQLQGALVGAGFRFPPTTVMILFHDHGDDAPMETRRSDVAVLADQEVRVEPPVFLEETPGGLYAVTPHFGSFEEIGDTWEKWRREWLPTSGWRYDATRPSLEWYQNDPGTVPAELLLTLLCDPVVRE